VKDWRFFLTLAGFAACSLFLIARVSYLVFADGDRLLNEGNARSIRVMDIPAPRAQILDRRGQPLAVSTPVYSVKASPKLILTQREKIEKTAAVLGSSHGDMLRTLLLEIDKPFVYLKKRVSWGVAEELKDLSIDGLTFDRSYKRYYPLGEMATHVVGKTDIDDRGIEGIELSQDFKLQGTPGSRAILIDRKGSVVKNLDYISVPVLGSDVQLSLDSRLQYVAYKELKSAVAAHRASTGSLVILEANSGEILAMVNQPSYNPNAKVLINEIGMKNRSVTDSYAPGSTVKPFVALAAIENQEFRADTLIDTSPGFLRIGSKLIQDPRDRGIITLREAIKKSSQVAIVKVAGVLDSSSIFQVLEKNGFGRKVNSGLPGEISGSLPDLASMGTIDEAALSYGYGLSVSPLQLARSYLAFAGSGFSAPVSILKEESTSTIEKKRLFESSHIAEVIGILTSVTQAGGTGSLAGVPGFQVAGKTGTIRLVSEDRYDDERHGAWFVGIIPARAPKLVIVVFINEPKAGLNSGGSVAAPVFARVAERSLQILGVAL
jgi:cell division protein FtsI (penicillin-binding protein 3)